MATESQQITQMIASRYGTANYGNLQVLKWQYYDYVRMTPSTGIVSQKLLFHPAGFARSELADGKDPRRNHLGSERPVHL